MPIFDLFIVFAAGTVAGFINILAGGGSLITLPALMLILGLPAAVANGTNRIGLAVEAAVGVVSFKKKDIFDPKLSILLSIPAIIGAIIGSMIAVSIPEELFKIILSAIMIVILPFVVLRPAKKPTVGAVELSRSELIISVISFFFIGLYGGFVQAGVGLIIIAVLSIITSISLVNINSIKIFVVGAYMIPSLSIFVFTGNVNWTLGFVLACGMGLGAWLGTHAAVKKGDKLIKVVLIIIVLYMALKLSGLF